MIAPITTDISLAKRAKDAQYICRELPCRPAAAVGLICEFVLARMHVDRRKAAKSMADSDSGLVKACMSILYANPRWSPDPCHPRWDPYVTCTPRAAPNAM